MTFPTGTQNSDPSQGLEPGSHDVESVRLHILPHPISNSHVISQAWGGSKRRGWGGLVEPPTFKNYWDIITIWLDLTMPEIPFPLKTFRLNHSGRDCPLQPPTQPHQPPLIRDYIRWSKCWTPPSKILYLPQQATITDVISCCPTIAYNIHLSEATHLGQLEPGQWFHIKLFRKKKHQPVKDKIDNN